MVSDTRVALSRHVLSVDVTRWRRRREGQSHILLTETRILPSDEPTKWHQDQKSDDDEKEGEKHVSHASDLQLIPLKNLIGRIVSANVVTCVVARQMIDD